MKFFLLSLLIGMSFTVAAQKITLSGIVKDKASQSNLPFVNIIIKKLPDSTFVAGTISDDNGRFTIGGVSPGDHVVTLTFVGYDAMVQPLLVGRLSEFLDLGVYEMTESAKALGEVVVQGQRDAVAETLDRKTFKMADNINQSGGSLLGVMQNLPGITVSDGVVRLRGNDRVAILIDGKQTALTGFGNQTSLDNIPASAIDHIDIINNPSAKYDANGNAGIINIIFKRK
ncbi:MAG: carboxypeptidase-like regulatory domain-containing protein [Bacteroidota bacterium]